MGKREKRGIIVRNRDAATLERRKGSARVSKAKFVLLMLEVDGNIEMTCG
jgi:hypothetical protein